MNMANICDHTSVGLIVIKNGRLLLIERKQPPYGFAPPAGHVDDHGAGLKEAEAFAAAAQAELTEETGLEATALTLLYEGKKHFACRRDGGDWHYWRVYRAEVVGETQFSTKETKSYRWVNREDLSHILTKESTIQLDPVWYELFADIHILDLLASKR